MDVKGEVLLQLYNKSKLRNGTKTYLEQNFFSICNQIEEIRVYCPFKLCLKHLWNKGSFICCFNFKDLVSLGGFKDHCRELNVE